MVGLELFMNNCVGNSSHGMIIIQAIKRIMDVIKEYIITVYLLAGPHCVRLSRVPREGLRNNS
jgi:hypothetical protein